MSERDIRLQAGRSARELKRRARSAIAGGEPTRPIGLRGQESGPDDAHVRRVIDLGLRVGESLLATGASAADATSAVLRLTRAYGLRAVHVDVIYSSITISHNRGVERDPITVLRVVAINQQDFTRFERVQRLVRDAESGDLPVERARARLDDISRAPHPYSRLIVTLANLLLGAAVATLLGAGPALALLSGLTTATVERSVRWLATRQVPAFFNQVAGAAIPTLVAVAINALGHNAGLDYFAAMQPSVIVASGVVVLLAGLTTVAAAQDTIDGFYITAAGRTFEVLTLSGGIVAGVLLVLSAAQHLGVDLRVRADLAFSGTPALRTLCALLIAVAAAVSSYSGPRTVLLAAGIGAVAWLTYQAALAFGAGGPTASGVAALAIGALSTLFGWRLRVPSLALVTSAIVPLLPGLTVYRGIFEIVDPQLGPAVGGATLLQALLTGLAIASGATLGSLPGRLSRPDIVSRKRAPEQPDG